MKIMFHFDDYHIDVWSGRQVDYDIWFIMKDIWLDGVSELAVVNQSSMTLTTAGREGITIYSSITDFTDATTGPYICLECPKNSPTELLADHTFDDNAWYCIGPPNGWLGQYLGTTTLGIEQEGNAELHAPFVSAVLCYSRYRAG